MADSSPLPGGGGKPGIGGIPIWVFITGAGAVALFLWYRNRQAAAAAGTTGTPSGALMLPTDPNTGLPIDPYTGLPWVTSQPSSTSQTMSQWMTAVESGLANSGFSPSLISQALYDYSQGNSLNAGEANVLNTAFGKVGYSPESLPFYAPTGWAPAQPAVSQSTAWQNAINTINTTLYGRRAVGPQAATTSSVAYQIAVITNRMAHTVGLTGFQWLPGTTPGDVTQELGQIQTFLTQHPATQTAAKPATTARPATTPAKPSPFSTNPTIRAQQVAWITAYSKSH